MSRDDTERDGDPDDSYSSAVDGIDMDRRRLMRDTAVISAAGAFSGLAGCGSGGDSPGGQQGGPQDGENGGQQGGQTAAGGGMDASDRVVRLEVNTRNRSQGLEQFEMMKMIVRQINELGIQAEQNAMAYGEWISRKYGTYEFKLTGCSWGGNAERVDPLRYLGLFYGPQIGGYNNYSYHNPEYDEVYERFSQSYDREVRKEAAFEAQEILCEDVPCVISTYIVSKAAYNTDKFSGWTLMPGNTPFRNVWNLTSLEPQTDDRTVFEPGVGAMETINPIGMTGNTENIYHRFVYDRLVRLGADGSPQPSSAEDWEFVDDTTVDVTLKDGLTFHDGESVDPEDVKFTWEFFETHDSPYLSAHYQPVDSVEVLDDGTIRFNLTDPYAGIISYSFFIMPILPQHVWSDVTAREDIDHPGNWPEPDWTGSGPLIAEEINLPERMVFSPFEDFWLDWPENGIDRYIFRRMGGAEQALVELQKGNAAFIFGMLTSQYERLVQEDFDHLKVVLRPNINWRKLSFHTQMEPTSDPAFRRAIAHAIDQEAINQVIFGGNSVPGIAGNVVAPVNEFWHNPDVKRYEGGVERGRELLEEAGYEWDDQGRLLYPEDMLPLDVPDPGGRVDEPPHATPYGGGN